MELFIGNSQISNIQTFSKIQNSQTTFFGKISRFTVSRG
eukprot:UN27470